MSIISKKDAARITRAIAAAEKKTSGEIIAVVARTSDDYRFIPLLWAALIALVTPPLLFTLTQWSPAAIYAAQLGAFATIAIAVLWRPLRIALVPGAIKRARAHARAMEQFLTQDLHTTKGRTGVLIFISVAERYAEVIADEGIYKKVPPGIWDDAVAGLTVEIAQGRAGDGLIAAVKICGGVLAEHFPPDSADKDELPNHLIVLE
ncbi:MAG: TPM domain-containing protein [Alphaproteobacteria bacterium]